MAWLRPAVLAGLSLAALGLGGCGAQIASVPLIGQSEAANKLRPAVAPDYQPVFQQSGRTDKPMSAAERAKLEADLATAGPRAVEETRERINAQ